jgi:hypothetical protein
VVTSISEEHITSIFRTEITTFNHEDKRGTFPQNFGNYLQDFNSEDEGDMFISNITDCMASQPRRSQST